MSKVTWTLKDYSDDELLDLKEQAYKIVSHNLPNKTQKNNLNQLLEIERELTLREA